MTPGPAASRTASLASSRMPLSSSLQHTRRHAKWTGAHAAARRRGSGRGRTSEQARAAAHTRRSSLLCFAASASLSTPDRSLPPSVRLFLPPRCCAERRAIKAGGIWLGDPEAVEQRCAQSARKYGRHVGAVAAAPMKVQSAMILLSYCCRPSAMLNHYVRVVRPELLDGAALIADDAMVAAIAAATRTDPAVLQPGLPGAALEQLRQPSAPCRRWRPEPDEADA